MNLTDTPDRSFNGTYYDPDLEEFFDQNRDPIKIRPQSFKVFLYLAGNADRVVSKDELFQAIWENKVVTDDSLVKCITEIRGVIDHKQNEILMTVPKRGYLLKSDTVDHKNPNNLQSRNEDIAPDPNTLPTIDIPADRPSIAVMDFQDASLDPKGSVLSYGLSIDIHSNLSRVSHLFVISKVSASRVQNLPPQQIGQCLGVSYLVTGTTQSFSNRVRITISLIDARYDRTLWSEQYDRTADDIFELQQEITYSVISEIDSRIEKEEIKKAFLLSPGSLRAWEFYHKGLWYSMQTDHQGVNSAVKFFKKSVHTDPSFARAYAGLSLTCITKNFLHMDKEGGNLPDQALEYAYRCIDLDDHDAWGHWSLGRAFYLKKKFNQSMEAVDRSLKLKPNFSYGNYTKAIIYSNSDHEKDMIPFVDKAIRLSPLDRNKFAFYTTKILIYLLKKSYQESAEWAARSVNEPSAYHLTHAISAVSFELADKKQLAKKHIRIALEMMPSFSIKNYKASIPHINEESFARKIIIDTMIKIGVPIE